jgi:hypothetical protein
LAQQPDQNQQRSSCLGRPPTLSMPAEYT